MKNCSEYQKWNTEEKKWEIEFVKDRIASTVSYQIHRHNDIVTAQIFGLILRFQWNSLSTFHSIRYHSPVWPLPKVFSNRYGPTY